MLPQIFLKSVYWKLQKQQSKDECLSAVISWLETTRRLPEILYPVLRKLLHECPRLTIRHGILCRKVKKAHTHLQPFKLSFLQLLLLQYFQDCMVIRLVDIWVECTLQRARRICYCWPYMSPDISPDVLCWALTMSNTQFPSSTWAQLQPIQAERQIDKIAADITELSGLPESIHTAQGRQLLAALGLFNCVQLCTPYHAQSDGMEERLNRTLKDQLCKYITKWGWMGPVLATVWACL